MMWAIRMSVFSLSRDRGGDGIGFERMLVGKRGVRYMRSGE